MPPRSDSALAEAAAVFATELANYSRLGRLFLETPLGSVKHLERANLTLGEIAESEERLQSAGTALAQALGGVRSQQEQLAKDVVAHVPVVQARNKRLQDLMAELGSVATEVQGLNTVIDSKRGADGEVPTTADAIDISQLVLGLSGRADQIATTAHEAEFEEVATQAHALHQRLQAIGKKLQKAGGGGSA